MTAGSLVERTLPVGLVPLAWGFTAVALFTPRVTDRTALIALGVMCVLFALFAVHPGMGEGVLRVWRGVLVGGLLTTLPGVFALVRPGFDGLLLLPIAGWLVLPAVALVPTARATGDRRYTLFAVLAGVGALTALVGLRLLPGDTATAVGLALATLGQAASVALAAAQNTG